MTFSKGTGLLMILGLGLWMMSPPAEAKKKKKLQVENADDLQIVDCSLPGRIRRLGNLTPYITKGRRVRTSAIDCRIRGGDYVEYDRSSYAASLAFWQPAAEEGDAEAQTYVGEIYEKRQNPDLELAAIWYRKAAEQGYGRAQVNLAHLYEQGLGVRRDLEAARELFGRAAGISGEVVLDAMELTKALQREIGQLQERLKTSESELEAAGAELEKSQRELEEARRSLKQAQETRTAAVADRVAQLANALRDQEVVVEQRQQRLAKREQIREALRKELATLEEKRIRESAGPEIEILRPDVLATRGSLIVRVFREVTETVIRGRALASAGLRQLTVDDRPLQVDSGGFFDISFPRPKQEQRVSFVAFDRLGREARRILVLRPVELDSVPTTRLPQRRSRVRELQRDFAPNGFHALIIGIADYAEFRDLETAERDAQELQAVLESQYGFSTTLLLNPSRTKVFYELNKLAEMMVFEQNLVIYYAGHGQIGPQRQQGYWIPANAKDNDPDTWVMNQAITEYLDRIPAKRILVVSDSCYSGTFTRSGLTQLATKIPASPKTGPPNSLADRRSRTVLTSGGLQPVLDVGGGGNSLFAAAFLQTLKVNNSQISGDALRREVAKRMAPKAYELGVDQVPEYAPIAHSGHVAGDFILVPASPDSMAANSSLISR